MKDFLNKAANAVGNAGKSAMGQAASAANSVESAVQGAKQTVLETAAGVAQAGRHTAFTVESTVQGARDAVVDKAAGAAGITYKMYHTALGTAHMMVDLGILVGAFVAPVPTAIGVGLLWLIQRQFRSIGAAVDEAVEEDRANRKLERVTGLLKKYGQIPETATLQTRSVTMEINSGTGVVKGEVLAGEFKGKELETLADEDLARLIEYAKDDDTKSILEAYQSLRKARAAQPGRRTLGL